jgi:RecB family exonuclease
VITPRETRLVRVHDLHQFRRAVAALAADPLTIPTDRLVIVPTRGAATILARVVGGDRAALVTREELYEHLAARLPGARTRLSAYERDSLMQAAAAAARAATSDLSFAVRPGLVAEILRFYDELRRQSQRVPRFEELVDETLGPAAAAGDRGAGRVLQQTRFLAAAFRGYEQRLLDAGADDEHTLRQQLVDHPSASAPRHVVVAVADWIADPAGLFVADFDLLARLPGLDRLDIVATEGMLASGFLARLRDWLPGLDETAGETLLPAEAPRRPLLVRPAFEGDGERLWFTDRDRQEELVAVARRLAARSGEPGSSPDEVAVVARRPLPYLYLAPEAFGAAGIPWQATDALPLAAEPFAAAVDVVLDVVESGFTRDSLVALLRSPHLALASPGGVPAESVAALNRALGEQRYLGGLERLGALPTAWETARAASARAMARPALDAVLAAARDLSGLAMPAPASVQITRLIAFLIPRLRALTDGDPYAARERRARAAVVEILERLAAAHAAHHDPPWTIAELGNAVRRWIGEQTFAAGRSDGGVHLLDDQAARFGDFEDLAIVGLVDGEWPEPVRRNIFYPTSLLKALGWPSEKDRRGAEDARFLDLLGSARRSVTLSTFTLDEESLVMRSMQLDEVSGAGLSSVTDEPVAAAPNVFPDEALTASPPSLSRLDAGSREWAGLRAARPAASAPEFHGQTGLMPPRPWSVSALETYLACPFKFFAQHVLRLGEEPEDEEVMDPRRQGLLMHGVFEAFFKAWQAAGHRAITPGNLDDARAMLQGVVDRALEDLPGPEAALERTRLLGSPAAAGLGEAVFRMEAERPVPVVERLLEHDVSGDLEIATAEGPRTVALRGKIDRLDLLADGTFRLVDYKLGWPPGRGRALQLPIYGLSAERCLSGYRGREWVLGEAVYLAFKGPKRVVPLFSSDADRVRVLLEARARLAAVIDGIESGRFPPSPDDVFRCETCSFSSVCRLDHVDLT